MKIYVAWIYYSLLKVSCRYLIWAACLWSILNRATMTLVLHFFKSLRPVARVLVILGRVRWLGIRLHIIIVSAGTCLPSTWRSCSLRMTWLHVILLLRLLNWKSVIVHLHGRVASELILHLLLLLLLLLIILWLIISITVLIHNVPPFVGFVCLSDGSHLLSLTSRQLLLLLLR